MGECRRGGGCVQSRGQAGRPARQAPGQNRALSRASGFASRRWERPSAPSPQIKRARMPQPGLKRAPQPTPRTMASAPLRTWPRVRRAPAAMQHRDVDDLLVVRAAGADDTASVGLCALRCPLEGHVPAYAHTTLARSGPQARLSPKRALGSSLGRGFGRRTRVRTRAFSGRGRDELWPRANGS